LTANTRPPTVLNGIGINRSNLPACLFFPEQPPDRLPFFALAPGSLFNPMKQNRGVSLENQPR
jgi:hypothetical protein